MQTVAARCVGVLSNQRLIESPCVGLEFFGNPGAVSLARLRAYTGDFTCSPPVSSASSFW